MPLLACCPPAMYWGKGQERMWWCRCEVVGLGGGEGVAWSRTKGGGEEWRAERSPLLPLASPPHCLRCLPSPPCLIHHRLTLRTSPCFTTSSGSLAGCGLCEWRPLPRHCICISFINALASWKKLMPPLIPPPSLITFTGRSAMAPAAKKSVRARGVERGGWKDGVEGRGGCVGGLK